MKNWAEQLSEPQITGKNPLICLRVIRPSMPQDGHESTAQYGSSFSPTWPAFSSTKTVPGCICSGIHSVRMFSSPTMSPPVEPNFRAYEAFFNLRIERDIEGANALLFFPLRITARTCRTVSVRQIASIG